MPAQRRITGEILNRVKASFRVILIRIFSGRSHLLNASAVRISGKLGFALAFMCLVLAPIAQAQQQSQQPADQELSADEIIQISTLR